MIDSSKLESYWQDIPTSKADGVTYPELMLKWDTTERVVRMILHELSSFDNGDDYVLIRSGRNSGFYKTDDEETITAYKRECLSKGRSIFAPVKKINRVLSANSSQFEMQNNMRLFREAAGMKQKEVCEALNGYGFAIDTALLSKMENGVCMPTPFQIRKLSEIYGCESDELLKTELSEFY